MHALCRHIYDLWSPQWCMYTSVLVFQLFFFKCGRRWTEQCSTLLHGTEVLCLIVFNYDSTAYSPSLATMVPWNFTVARGLDYRIGSPLSKKHYFFRAFRVVGGIDCKWSDSMSLVLEISSSVSTTVYPGIVKYCLQTTEARTAAFRIYWRDRTLKQMKRVGGTPNSPTLLTGNSEDRHRISHKSGGSSVHASSRHVHFVPQ
jgi:hypothetical protein